MSEPEEMIGENGLSRDDITAILTEALERLKDQGVTAAVLTIVVDNGQTQHCNYNFFGGYYAARGLLETAREGLKSTAELSMGGGE